ncbi:MAG TPA: DinB family protein [Longimicrobiales bacterium]
MADAWLKGPVDGVPPALQPVAHAFLNLQLELDAVLADLSDEEAWRPAGTAAPIGFHVRHLCGSIDRLLTYARGMALNDAQLATLGAEKELTGPGRAGLRELVRQTVEAGLAQLRATPAATLDEPREVGRKRLPSTVRGLLFHAAEHGARHTGQAVTTKRFVRSRE